MKNISISILTLILLISLSSGCMQLALRATPSLIPNFTTSLFEECDPELAKSALPTSLKLMEGLLKNDPQNKQILTTLSMGFAGYSMLFIEDVDPARASTLYLRAKDYGIRALGEKAVGLRNGQISKEGLRTILKDIGKEDLKALLWTTVSWNAWIFLNLDKPAALAQTNVSQACLERVLEIDPTTFNGLPFILMGVSLSARSPMFGGNVKKAKAYFDEAFDVRERKFFLSQYLFAKYYAVRIQDKELFRKVLEEIIQKEPTELKEVCLINTVMRIKAERLISMEEEFFL